MDMLAKFLTDYPLKEYKKGQVILCQDTTPKYCYVVSSGFVKAYTITASGDEKPIHFDGTYDIFPIAWAFGKAQTAEYYHQAYTDCQIYRVPREDFARFIREHPKLLHRFFNYLLDLCWGYQAHVTSLEQAKASDKIIYTLHYLTRRFGRKVARSRVRMLLPLTQQDLANFVGLTRETTGTQLKQLEKAGIIHYYQQRYIVYVDRLRALLDRPH